MNDHEERLSREETERLGEEIAKISAHIDAATHRLLGCIRRFDASGGWHDQGALTCAHWLQWRIGVSVGAAREYVRVARALGELPLIDEALRRGELSYCKVRALTRVATPENEATLLEWARAATGAQLEKLCAKYRRVLRCEGFIPVEDPEFRYVRTRDTSTGMVRVTAQLLPEEAAVVMQAIEAMRRRATPEADDVSAETPANLGERLEAERRENATRVDALVSMAESVLAGEGEGNSPSPVEVVVHVEEENLRGDPEATLEDGRRLEPETTQRLLCDAALVRVVEDAHGTPLDVGRRTRAIPPAIRRALRTRDGGCRFPGCTNRRTDGHHIVPWSEGGETRLGNLVSLCRRHHRFVHELGWRVEVRTGNEIVFLDASGRAAAAGAARVVVADDVIGTMRVELADEGIDVEALGAPRQIWSSENDFGMAVEALMYNHPRTRPDVPGET